MRHAKKVMLVPQEGRGPELNVTELNTQEVSPLTQKKENSIRKYAYERELKRCKILLKLAAYGGYDDLGRIKLPDGTFMEDSDIIPLLMHVLSPGRNIKGINEFVDLLHRADVSPELVINASVRDMLMRRGTLQRTYNTPKENSSKDNLPQESPISRGSKTILLVNPRPFKKRDREDIDESEETEVKRLRSDDTENRQLSSKRIRQYQLGPSSVLRNKKRKDNEVNNNQQEDTNWSLPSDDND
jgi:hypothetical protein